MLKKKKKGERSSLAFSNIVFYPAALSVVSQLFSFLESAVKLLISSFKGSEDIGVFLLHPLSQSIRGNLLFLGTKSTCYAQSSGVTC